MALSGDALGSTIGVPTEDSVKFKFRMRHGRPRVDLGGQKKVGDTAYCVLGIFDISLPGMYGEDTIHYLPSCESVTE